MPLTRNEKLTSKRILKFMLDEWDRHNIDQYNAIAMLHGFQVWIIRKTSKLTIKQAEKVLHEAFK
jgi:hypothetical protein